MKTVEKIVEFLKEEIALTKQELRQDLKDKDYQLVVNGEAVLGTLEFVLDVVTHPCR